MENKSYMKELATMLDVELGERFNIKDFENNPCYFSESGLIDSNNCLCPLSFISRIIQGKLEIVKLPWKLYDGMKFYYIDYYGKVMCKTYVNKNGLIDLRLRMGNYFKTKEEAKSHKEKWLDNLKQKPDLSWRDDNEYWIPHEDEWYWFINTEGKLLRTVFKGRSGYDAMMLRMGNCFKTLDEADKYKEKWLEYLEKEPDLSWRVNE